MIAFQETVLERVCAAVGETVADNAATFPANVVEATGFSKRRVAAAGESLFDLAMRAARQIPAEVLAGVGGVVAATFSHEMRFPALAVRVASALGLPPSTPAFDLQMACSAYPYAVYLASRMSADSGSRVLVVNGDLQSPFADPSDAATAPLFSDAATATIVSSSGSGTSHFAALTRHSGALSCTASGPVKMDGFGVFSFVATEVSPFLASFVKEAGEPPFDGFVPHQANMYMVRRLASSLGMADILLTSGEEFANPGSCSIPLTLATRARPGRYLLAGFGAGLSAAAVTVRLSRP